jgi:hypothetical protein
MALADSGERNSDLGDSLYRVIAKSSINPHRKLQIVLTWTTDDITLQESKICQETQFYHQKSNLPPFIEALGHSL